MKKRVLTIALALLMTLSLLPVSAIADDHVHSFAETGFCQCGLANFPLYLSGGGVYKGLAGDLIFVDGLSFSDGVWTMENFTFSSVAETGIIIDGDATLNLVGENLLEMYPEGRYIQYGIRCDGTITVQGDGSLQVHTKDCGYYNYAICAYGGLNVSGGNVMSLAGNANYESYGVYYLSSLSGGTLTASGYDSAVYKTDVESFSGAVSVLAYPEEADKIPATLGTGDLLECNRWVQASPIDFSLFLAEDGTIHVNDKTGEVVTSSLSPSIVFADDKWSISDLNFSSTADTALIFENTSQAVEMAGSNLISAESDVSNIDLAAKCDPEEVAIWVAASADGSGSEPYSSDWTSYCWLSTVYPKEMTVNLYWYNADEEQITGENVPTELKLDMGEVPSIESTKKYQEVLEPFINEQKIYRWYFNGSYLTNASDIVMEIIKRCADGDSVYLYAVSDSYTYDGNMAYRKDFPSGFADYANHEQCFDILTYYNNRWIGTTYDHAYAIHNDLGENASISTSISVKDGQYALVALTVRADGADISGHLGVFADVKIGDNDDAEVTPILEDGSVVGFQITDDHTDSSCQSKNAQLQCYVSGGPSGKLAAALGDSGFYQDAICWFGPYYGADENWLNNQTETVSDTDSGFATSWEIDLKDGESKTCYLMIGVVNAAVNEAPRFITEPKFTTYDGEDVKDSGFISVNVANEVAKGANGGNMALTCTTSAGEVLQVTPQSLGAARKSHYSDPDEKRDLDQVAVFDRAQINAFPGTYFIKSVTATNAGGKTTTYEIPEEKKIVITSTPRERPLVIGEEEETENLREGWSYNEDEELLTIHGLEIIVEEEDTPALQMPAGTDIAVEQVLDEEGNPAENKIISTKGNGIEVVEGEETVEISGEGALNIKAGETGIEANNNELSVSAKTEITAKTGIKTTNDVTLGGDIVINATECGIDCANLEITEGSLTINFGSGDAFGENTKLSIPEGYEVIGGTIDEDGYFIPDEGATQVIIREVLHEDDIQYWINRDEKDPSYSGDAGAKAIQDYAKANGMEVCVLVDLTYFRQVNDGEPEQLYDLDEDITVSLEVPKELISNAASLKLIRLHDEKISELQFEVSEKDNNLIMKTSQFSYYAVLKKTSADTPKTGDQNILWLIVLMAVSGICGYGAYRRKKAE